MKREIKFRAWLYIDGTMQYEDLFGAEKFGGRDCEIMQYTGLKDKNGKEIYEGDIVCWVTDVIADSKDGFNRYEPEGLIGSVDFENGAFYVKGKDFYSYGEQMFMWCELEIIGNIYENPELL